jgi:hypothetical protein
LIFTTKGPTPGVTLVEWNILAASLGSGGMWGEFLAMCILLVGRYRGKRTNIARNADCHVRIGGATGTDLTLAECPASTTGVNDKKCQAASLMMHITKGGSGYFENVWLWVADHLIEFVSSPPLSLIVTIANRSSQVTRI